MQNIKKNKIKRILTGTAGAFIIATAAVLIYTNLTIKTKVYKVNSPLLNKNIVQISDLHGYNFGKDNANLINKIKECNPDIIVMTGDMVDTHDVQFKESAEFIKKLSEICMCFFIEGNHEAWLNTHDIEGYPEYINELKENGIIVLRDEKYEIPDTDIVIYGLCYYPNPCVLEDINKDKYNIVLCHNPQFTEFFSPDEPDLFLSGHTHGGQVYFPGIGRLFTHGQGIKAKYITGEWKINKSTLIISNGLGSSKGHLARFRVNVFPEIVKIEPQQN